MKCGWAMAGLLAALAGVSSMAAQGRPKITGVSHLAVYTTDAAKAEFFYVHDLGAMKAPDPQNAAGVRYYFSPVQFVEVLPLPEGWTSVGRLDHVGYNTADAEGLRRYMGAHGVAVPAAVTRGSDGSEYFEVKDPEGNRVQFVQPPARLPVVPVNPLSKHIIHVGYIVHDPAVEDGFYKTVLGFRPYWRGGRNEDSSDWISSQVPDGTDWIEYMHVNGPEKTGIPATMTRDNAGVLDHFSLGLPNMEKAEDMLYIENRQTGKHSDPKIGRDAKWQINMYDPDGTRAELMEFAPVTKPCCSPFTAENPKE